MTFSKLFLSVLGLCLFGSVSSADIDISQMKICRYSFPGSKGVIVQIPNQDANVTASTLYTTDRNYGVSTGFIYGGLNIQWLQQDYFNIPLYFINYNSLSGQQLEIGSVFAGVNYKSVNSKFVWGNKKFEASHCE